jgi:hypothetical protein
MVAHAAQRSGRFSRNELSATEIGFWLLTEPQYDAKGRAAIIRVLAAWPGARNLGPRLDALGRRGVFLAIPRYRRYPGAYVHVSETGYFHALFDVRHGQLLQYNETSTRDPRAAVGVGYILIEEQTRQETPTISDETVEQLG